MFTCHVDSQCKRKKLKINSKYADFGREQGIRDLEREIKVHICARLQWPEMLFFVGRRNSTEGECHRHAKASNYIKTDLYSSLNCTLLIPKQK